MVTIAEASGDEYNSGRGSRFREERLKPMAVFGCMRSEVWKGAEGCRSYG